MDALIDEGVVDATLVRVVLMVDFTRPIFSARRCGLLEGRLTKRAPPTTTRTAGEIGKAIGAALAGASAASAEAELAAALAESPPSVTARVKALVAACNARSHATDSRPFLESFQAALSQKHNRARQVQVFEFSATMPGDDMVVALDAHFDPVTYEPTCDAPPCFQLP